MRNSLDSINKLGSLNINKPVSIEVKKRIIIILTNGFFIELYLQPFQQTNIPNAATLNDRITHSTLKKCI